MFKSYYLIERAQLNFTYIDRVDISEDNRLLGIVQVNRLNRRVSDEYHFVVNFVS